jgi:hypothetical protein
MSLLNDIHSIVVAATAANLTAHTYTEVYAALADTININGTTVVMGGNSSIRIKVRSVSGGTKCFLFGEMLSTTYDNPSLNG